MFDMEKDIETLAINSDLYKRVEHNQNIERASLDYKEVSKILFENKGYAPVIGNPVSVINGEDCIRSKNEDKCSIDSEEFGNRVIVIGTDCNFKSNGKKYDTEIFSAYSSEHLYTNRDNLILTELVEKYIR